MGSVQITDEIKEIQFKILSDFFHISLDCAVEIVSFTRLLDIPKCSF